MPDKFKNKYRIDPARLQHWDYGWKAEYFITICTKDRNFFFGDIADDKMQLSHVGVIADLCWYEIKNHAKNVELGEFVVMPNHVHGILILNGGGAENDVGKMQNEKTHAFSLQQNTQPPEPKSIGQQRFQNQGKNTISSIIGGYKSAVTKHAHRLGFDFDWQALFHDHIIRDDKSFQTISEYIKNNPKNWSDDKFYP